MTGKIRTSGKPPWQPFGARLFSDVRDSPDSKFIKVGKRPARFVLKQRGPELSENIFKQIAETKPEKEKSKWNERDLHPLLTYFVYANPSFGRGREILTKTIFHEKSKKKGYSEWLYPGLVGFYLPLDNWESELIE